MGEDSFEKARRAFFGTVAATPKVSIPLGEYLKLQGSPTAEEPSRAPREASTASITSWASRIIAGTVAEACAKEDRTRTRDSLD
jgi:hypothetical protein